MFAKDSGTTAQSEGDSARAGAGVGDGAAEEPKSSLPDNFDDLVDEAIIIQEAEILPYVFDFNEEHRRERRREDVEIVAAGAISALISRVCCHPFDVIKNKMQRSPSMLAYRSFSRNMLHVARIIYAERGARGFYRAHGRAQLLGLLQTITLFYAYENFRVQLVFTSGLAPHANFCDFTAGMLAGATVVVLIHPLFVLKTRREAYQRLVHQFGKTKADLRWLPIGGWRCLYRGFRPTLAHSSTLYGFKFLIYDEICEHLLTQTEFYQRHEWRGVSLMASGAVTGVLANLCSYPLDSVKQHMMTTGLDRQRFKFDSTCRRIFQCVRLIWQREGVLGLYNGLVPCMLRSAVNTALQFSIFDSTVNALQDWA